MSPAPVILAAPFASDHHLQVRFTWCGDRFGHTVELILGGRVCPLLTSVEGAAGDREPNSPPLQQLHCEDRADGLRVALLVGMAGHNHWSMSVEAPGDGSGMVFDVACRRRPPESALGSLYRVTEGSVELTATKNETLFQAPHHGWMVTAIEESGVRATIESDHVACRIIPPPSAASTLRWKYQVGLGKRREARGWHSVV